FSVVNAVLLRPLPFANEKQLVVLQETRPDQPKDDAGVSYLNFNDWQTRSESFSAMAIVSSTEVALVGAGEAVRVRGAIVSADFFNVLGITPQLGRAFNPTDDRAGAAGGFNSVMLTHSCWQSRFNGDPQVIGRRITLDEENFTIVGVTPAGIF